ncbi:hypothetical protein C1645_862983 [Glomus cerebriforme]|uniref:Uncharacterized protein n=1 Tax=Glomus cerebriforme TaxID=658196 RepID=A0A397SBY7_9GLOM|nr:hypothetical protein C1645_862983 [Glomus cerebriforme]
MFDENDNLIIKERETEENLLGNRELLKYGYIIEDDEVDRRFVKLEEWLREKEIAIMDIRHGTMSHFKEMLHMEESIANEENRDTIRKFQKSLTYQWWDSRYQQPWKNDDLTNEIIRKIVEKKSFVREYEDVEELESSEDESKLGKLEDGELPLKVKGKMALKDKDDDEREKEIIITEKWREKGHTRITIAGIKRLLRLGYDEFRVENDIELINKYKEVREGEYFWNGEKYEKIRAIITEDIDEWMRESMESFGMKNNNKEENLECKICENKGHNEENCAEKKGERFQDRRETDYWEENDEEEKDNTDELEKIGEILSLGEHEDWDENIEDINENEIEDELQNIINTEGFDLSQNSESNSSLNIEISDTESKLSNYNLQELFQENRILNMATEVQMARLLERVHGLPDGALNNILAAGESMVKRIANAENEAGMLNMPPFSEREDEDVSD